MGAGSPTRSISRAHPLAGVGTDARDTPPAPLPNTRRHSEHRDSAGLPGAGLSGKGGPGKADARRQTVRMLLPRRPPGRPRRRRGTRPTRRCETLGRYRPSCSHRRGPRWRRRERRWKPTRTRGTRPRRLRSLGECGYLLFEGAPLRSLKQAQRTQATELFQVPGDCSARWSRHRASWSRSRRIPRHGGHLVPTSGNRPSNAPGAGLPLHRSSSRRRLRHSHRHQPPHQAQLRLSPDLLVPACSAANRTDRCKP